MRRAMGLMKCYTVRLKNFWISLVGLTAIIILLWYAGLTQDIDLSSKVILSLLHASYVIFILVCDFSTKQQERFYSSYILIATLVFSGFLIMALAIETDNYAVIISVVLILVSLPLLSVLWYLTKGKRLLQLAAIPLIIAALLYLAPPVTVTGLKLDFLLLPLPVVSCVLIVWALAARRTLTLAQRWRRCPVWGPLMESLTMLFIAIPIVALTVLVVNDLRFGEIWVAVSGVVVGVLFGNAVSTPLRRFLLALGDLSQKCQCVDGHKVFTPWR